MLLDKLHKGSRQNQFATEDVKKSVNDSRLKMKFKITTLRNWSVEALGQTGTLGLWDSDDSDRMGIEIRSYKIWFGVMNWNTYAWISKQMMELS